MVGIKLLAEFLGFSFDGIFKNQLKHIETIEWLLDPKTPDINDRGRTTLLAIGFIDAAMKNPGFPIYFFDQYNVPQCNVYMYDQLEILIEKLPNVDDFILDSYSLTYMYNK